MVIHRLKGILGVVAAGSFLLSSTAAVASTPAPVQQVDPWAVLTAMSNGAPAAAMCGAAAAAATAQAPGGCVLPVVDAPPPVQTVEAVPPPPEPVAGGGINPLFLALIAIAVGVGIFLAVNNNGGTNSPA
ncbi:MAG: hypothetical protein QOD54_1015 [Sphingomonadales bacterium]|nr:hypothetical protein [Sphingomonadales bacterium]